MTRPPEPEEHLGTYENMFPTSSGREAPGRDFEKDTIFLDPGDVLLNMPYEWHKVLNACGLSLGAAFRIIDTDYLKHLATRQAISEQLPNFETDMAEDVAHLLSSLRYASLDVRRAGMMLNELEYAHAVLQNQRNRRERERASATVAGDHRVATA